MATFVHFDLPADEPKRAKSFYEKLFGWSFTEVPGMDYHLIETADGTGKPGLAGGMGRRGAPEQRITNYIGVESVENSARQVRELGGRIIEERMTVPGWGYLTLCEDTEGNTFGLWQEDKTAK